MKVSREMIEKITHEVVEREYNGIKKRRCDLVSNSVSERLEEYENITPTADKYVEVCGRGHYVFFLPADQYADSDTDNGWILIDTTIEQFEDQLQYEFPEVAILPENDPRLDEWYSKINYPDK